MDVNEIMRLDPGMAILSEIDALVPVIRESPRPL